MAEVREGELRGVGVLGAAAYLACTWTWCIGMWLPVFLMRDFGALAWVVFAVPNVIGAASVGFVLRGGDAARRMVERHGGMIGVFSVWTVLFHVFFLTLVVMRAREDMSSFFPLAGEAVGAATIGLAVVVWRLGLGKALVAGAAVWLVSVGFGVAAWGTMGGWSPDEMPASGLFPMDALWKTAPIIAVGFLLCPFLDGTILGIRSRLGVGGGRAAFALGFGVLFLAMIGMTAVYGSIWLAGGGYSFSILPGHIAVQSAFTIGVHMRWLSGRGVVMGQGVGERDGRIARSVLLVFAALGVVLLAIAVRSIREPIRPWYTWQRLAYDVFLGAYALVFPSYVWSVVVGRSWGIGVRESMAACVVSVGVGLPCVVMGTVMQHHGWLVGAAVAVLMGPLVGWGLGKWIDGDEVEGLVEG